MAKITNFTVPHTRSPAIKLYKEIDRLQTFTNWPVPYIRSECLARWGFYYLGRSDIVQCYFCTVELGDWQPHDVVEREHLKWSQYCPLLNGRASNNVPIDSDFVGRIVPDVYGIGQLASAVSNGSGESTSRPNVTEPPPAEAGPSSRGTAVLKDAVKICKPMYPKYATEAVRLASFESWPKSIRQTPEQMADAGFFYTEKSDIVACFSCGGTLKDWLEGDDPWVEHADKFSGCHYLNLVKGPEFVQQCQTMRSTEDRIEPQVQCKSSEQHVDESEVSDAKMCKICYSSPYNTTFVPCGHVVACAKCASAVNRCPLCNEVFTDILRIYLS